jgi:excisionase family DNA binding protein
MMTNGKVEYLIDSVEVARRLDMTPHTIRWWVRMKHIPYVRIGRSVRFEPTVIEEFIRRHAVPERVEP